MSKKINKLEIHRYRIKMRENLIRKYKTKKQSLSMLDSISKFSALISLYQRKGIHFYYKWTRIHVCKSTPICFRESFLKSFRIHSVLLQMCIFQINPQLSMPIIITITYVLIGPKVLLWTTNFLSYTEEISKN